MKIQRNKLEKVTERWSSMSYCICRRDGGDIAGKSLKGQNNLIKITNVRANVIEWSGRIIVAIRM